MSLSEHPSHAAALPPGPGISPEGQARSWLESPCGLLEACHRKYGDIFTLRLGDFGTMVIVADPAAAGRLFKAPPGAYECRHFNDSYRYVMGDNALFVQDGDAHRRLKRMMTPPFRGAGLGAHGAQIRRAPWAPSPAPRKGGVIMRFRRLCASPSCTNSALSPIT